MTESELYGVGLVQSSEVKLISIDFHHQPQVDEDPLTDRMDCS
jgi:hypothetical protein